MQFNALFAYTVRLNTHENEQNADSETTLAVHPSGSLHRGWTGFFLAKMTTLLTSG